MSKESEIEALMRGNGRNNLRAVSSETARVYEILQGSDNEPTSQAETAAKDITAQAKDLDSKWVSMKGVRVASLNEELRVGHLSELVVPVAWPANLNRVDSADKDSDEDEP